MLLQFPKFACDIEIPDSFKQSAIQGLPLLHDIHSLILNSPEITPSALLERWRNNDNFSALQKMMQRDIVGIDEQQNIKTVMIDTISNLIDKHNDHRYAELEKKLQDAGLTDIEMKEYITLSTL